MTEFLQHPLTRGVIIGIATSLVLDLDAFLKFRQEHPGTPYDWVVVVVRCLKGAIASALTAAGVSAIS